MDDLSKLREIDRNWLIEEFADVVNQLLSDFLAIDSGNQKVTEQVNSRTIRHYASLGLIDQPQKLGKYAQYNYRHLLQILLVKKLLSQGYGTTTIDRLLKSKSDRELENLLTGGVEIQVSIANPALAYLEQLSSANRRVSSSAQTSIPQIQLDRSISEWRRIEIIPGLEIHLRSDFPIPQSHREKNSLHQLIIDRLKSFI